MHIRLPAVILESALFFLIVMVLVFISYSSSIFITIIVLLVVFYLPELSGTLTDFGDILIIYYLQWLRKPLRDDKILFLISLDLFLLFGQHGVSVWLLEVSVHMHRILLKHRNVVDVPYRGLSFIPRHGLIMLILCLFGLLYHFLIHALVIHSCWC